MFEILEQINKRPMPFEYYTASDLWTDEYTSKQMLACHLNSDIDVSSRRTAFIDKSVNWIMSHFEITPETNIADFGCGPGLYTTRLAASGARITGIDFSKRSIDYAKETAAKACLDINYVNCDYLDYTTDERYDLIMMIMCDYCALSPVQREAMLAKFMTILKPGGSLLLDVYSLKAFENREENTVFAENLLNGFWAPGKYYGFLNIFKYENEKVVLDKFTIIESSRTRTVYNWLQYFSPEDIEDEFAKSGFRINNFYADVAGTPFNSDGSEFAVVAEKA